MAKGGLTCFEETFVLKQTFVLRMNFSAKIPALLQAAKRCRQLKIAPYNFEMNLQTLNKNRDKFKMDTYVVGKELDLKDIDLELFVEFPWEESNSIFIAILKRRINLISL